METVSGIGLKVENVLLAERKIIVPSDKRRRIIDAAACLSASAVVSIGAPLFYLRELADDLGMHIGPVRNTVTQLTYQGVLARLELATNIDFLNVNSQAPTSTYYPAGIFAAALWARIPPAAPCGSVPLPADAAALPAPALPEDFF